MMNSKYNKLIELLEYHDWTWEYSDDYRAYQWGHDNQIDIERELDNLGRTKEAMMSELVDMLLNNSQAGLFDLNLVKGQKVLRAATYLNDMKDYSVHYLYGSPKKGQSLTEVQTLLMGELEKIKKGQFSDTLLKSIILDYTISKMKSSESNQGRITDLTSAFI